MLCCPPQQQQSCCQCCQPVQLQVSIIFRIIWKKIRLKPNIPDVLSTTPKTMLLLSATNANADVVL
jgi:hypothetical protein